MQHFQSSNDERILENCLSSVSVSCQKETTRTSPNVCSFSSVLPAVTAPRGSSYGTVSILTQLFALLKYGREHLPCLSEMHNGIPS